MGLILGRAEALDDSALRDVEQFLYLEAALLDDKSWQDWLALYTEDCFYWIPSMTGQADPINTVSLFAENRMMMEMRIIRVTPSACLQPGVSDTHQPYRRQRDDRSQQRHRA